MLLGRRGLKLSQALGACGFRHIQIAVGIRFRLSVTCGPLCLALSPVQFLLNAVTGGSFEGLEGIASGKVATISFVASV